MRPLSAISSFSLFPFPSISYHQPLSCKFLFHVLYSFLWTLPFLGSAPQPRGIHGARGAGPNKDGSIGRLIGKNRARVSQVFSLLWNTHFVKGLRVERTCRQLERLSSFFWPRNVCRTSQICWEHLLTETFSECACAGLGRPVHPPPALRWAGARPPAVVAYDPQGVLANNARIIGLNAIYLLEGADQVLRKNLSSLTHADNYRLKK